ncbi:MAG: cyanophycinase [Anaerolineae bacterium]|nr:cyanophycinase [Anaerolineae bacterium]
MKKHLFFILLLSSIILSSPVLAQDTPGLLIPIGGGYADVYAGFSQAAVANAREGQVNILILAPTYSTNAIEISEAERQTNTKDAEERRFQVEEACKRAAPPDVTCKATLAPIFTRADASDAAHLKLFSEDLAAVFILGGDQTVAMEILANTPAETRLTELHHSGTIIGGTSAGGGMQSVTMLAGYNPNYASESALFFGAADLWNSPEKHGLPSGLQNAILDQHFHQRARLGRLVNAILQPGVIHVGVGVDAYTGVIADDEILRGVFGLYTVTILDAETYHAADGVRYVPVSESRPPLVSARNILVSLLSPGNFAYDLKTRQAQFGQLSYSPQKKIERRFEGLNLPEGAGALILAGDLSNSLDGNAILARFLQLAGGENANLLVISDGGASKAANQRTAQRYADALIKLGAKASTGSGDSPGQEITGFVFVGRDASKMTPPEWVKEYWLAGKPILADNAAATLMSSFYAAHPPTPSESEDAEAATQQSFWRGKTNIQPGLGLVDITIQPQMLADNRFGRWFALAYRHPDLLAVGLNKDTAIEIRADGASVLGENAIFALDLRFAQLALGTDDGFVITNGLLDIFAPGEPLQPETADVNAIYPLQPTPALRATKTPAEEPSAQASPTPGVVSLSEAPEATATQASAENVPSQAPLQPPAQSIPPVWGLLIGLVLVVSAILAANFIKKRR